MAQATKRSRTNYRRIVNNLSSAINAARDEGNNIIADKLLEVYKYANARYEQSVSIG